MSHNMFACNPPTARNLPGVTGNTPAPTAVNNNGTALASISVNVIGGQGTLPSSRQTVTATTSNFVNEGASIAQEP